MVSSWPLISGIIIDTFAILRSQHEEDDGGDNQVDEEHIEEVEDVGGEGDDAIVFPSNWRASEAVVDVCAEAVEEVGAVHIAFEIISSSIRPVEL